MSSPTSPNNGFDAMGDVISDLVTNGSIEMSATSLDRVAADASFLPFGTSVYVPSPQKEPLASNLPLVEALHSAGMEAVPHIAARKVPSREELKEYLETVVAEYGVHRVLVIGGDIRKPRGPYPDSAALLKDEILGEAGIHEIGVAGYPEGHPRIPPKVIAADLDAKLDIARERRLGIEIITQFSFAPTRIIEYCAMLSHKAPNVPVYVGMAGPCSPGRLLKYARYCGVSASVRALSDLGVKAAKLATHTDPEDQLIALGQYCAVRESCNVIGVHIFSFGGFEQSARWMRNHCLQVS
jgi:methylenetetrahydrofolate reductase (NADPH)